MECYMWAAGTIVPRKEIGSGLLAGMLRDLSIEKEDF